MVFILDGCEERASTLLKLVTSKNRSDAITPTFVHILNKATGKLLLLDISNKGHEFDVKGSYLAGSGFLKARAL